MFVADYFLLYDRWCILW